MMFNWSRALYHSFRWAFVGTIVGLVFGFIGTLSGGRDDLAGMLSIAGFYVGGFGRLGWELFTKPHPND